MMDASNSVQASQVRDRAVTQASEPRLQLDHAGGAALTGLTQQSLCINRSDLINLDIINATRLTELELSAPTIKPRQLRLRQVPNISRIRGPAAADGLGAVVHIDGATFSAGSDGQGLHIDMPVSRIDAAWRDPQGALRTFAFDAQPTPNISTAPYWQSVQLLRARRDQTQANVLANASANDLVVIDFADVDTFENDIWSIQTHAELACLNLRNVKTLSVSGARALHVLGADGNLHTLQTNSPELIIEKAPKLGHIQNLSTSYDASAALHAITMTHCSVDKLHIETKVEQLKLKHASHITVTLNDCNSLQVHSCPQIQNIHCDPLPLIELSGTVSNSLLEFARLSMNESLIRSNMADITNADNEALTQLLNMVPMQVKGRDLYPAMLVLRKAFSLGVDIERIWALRNELNINHLAHYKPGPKRKGRYETNNDRELPSQWRWKVRGDGCAEVWRIDLALWAHALNADVAHAKQLRNLVGRSISSNDYACQAAVYMLQNHAEVLAAQEWLRLLKQTYKVRKRTSHDANLFKLGDTVQTRFALNLIKFATALPDQDDALKRLVVDYIIDCYSIDTVERLASKLFALHALQLRMRCIEKSKQPELYSNHLIDYAIEPLNVSNVPSHTRYLKLALGAHTGAKEAEVCR